MAKKPYRDPKTTKIEDWKWHPMELIRQQLNARRELPEHVLPYAEHMQQMASKAQKGEISPRDLIKAYTITQASIGRSGLSHATATKRGMKLQNTGEEWRPEGVFAEYLGSPEGQRYLDMAERGEVDPAILKDLVAKFAPFGKQNVQAQAMEYAAQHLPQQTAAANAALTGSLADYRKFSREIKGINSAKSGFIGSLLGRGDQPTLDARQIALHSLSHPTKEPESMMNRGNGLGGEEAVDRLTARHNALGYDIPHELAPFAQHLIHHDIWDQRGESGPTKTTHEDLIRAMRGYSKGGDVEPTTEQMRQALAQKGYLTHTPKNRNPAVGQRYDVSEAYGLAPKNQVDMENHKGASVMLMPWDSLSRNVDITGISGHELPETVTSHGGHDFSRDLEHILQGIAGASNEKIAKRISTRESIARMENEKKGGTGEILHLPTTMGNYAEGFALTPAELAFQLHKRAELSPEHTAELEELIRNSGPAKHFRGFVGFGDPEAYANQIRTGEGLDKPGKAGELRKLLNMKLIHGKRAQELMDFNGEDAQNAMLDPALRGVPKGYLGNTIIGSDPDHMTLTPSDSDRDPYDTRFSGRYLGTLGHSFPAEILLQNQMSKLTKQFTNAGKQGNIRNMVLGALEKRNSGVSQILNNETLDRYGKYMLAREKKLRTGHYAEGGEVKADEPSHDEMLAHVMLHGMSSLKDVGANEAPNLQVKTYVPQGPGPGMPVGGVDFQPQVKGQQMLPGQPGQPPGQLGQPPQGGPAPGGAPGQPPAPAPGGPQSNILQMTPQGQAMAAMKASPPPQQPMAKKRGGTVKDYIRITERPL